MFVMRCFVQCCKRIYKVEVNKWVRGNGKGEIQKWIYNEAEK